MTDIYKHCLYTNSQFNLLLECSQTRTSLPSFHFRSRIVIYFPSNKSVVVFLAWYCGVKKVYNCKSWEIIETVPFNRIRMIYLVLINTIFFVNYSTNRKKKKRKVEVMELLDICVDHKRNQGIKESPHCTHGIYHFSYIVKEEQNSRLNFSKYIKQQDSIYNHSSTLLLVLNISVYNIFSFDFIFTCLLCLMKKIGSAHILYESSNTITHLRKIKIIITNFHLFFKILSLIFIYLFNTKRPFFII
ncbi:hypothetical protein OIU85_020783 [Salix viminalis]|uniref:Uncharacterized protein n=1 Tax=Salix viminalis TaxID=40686 RepID=A0A9Q0ZD31_SALVM|nr:hypothetical protein OIU85_020783 [Salix viminalis]